MEYKVAVPEPDLSDLFADSNLYEVYKAAPSFRENRFNLITAISTFLVLGCFALWRLSLLPAGPHFAFTETFLNWATVGWTLSSTLLGFLTAGFALLVSVLRPSAIVHLHSLVPPDSKANLLRDVFVAFAEMFIQLMLFLAFSILVLFLGSKGGPLIEIRMMVKSIDPSLLTFCGYALFVFWGTWFSVLLLKLKSFIYNLYQNLMFGMAHSVHSDDRIEG